MVILKHRLSLRLVSKMGIGTILNKKQRTSVLKEVPRVPYAGLVIMLAGGYMLASDLSFGTRSTDDVEAVGGGREGVRGIRCLDSGVAAKCVTRANACSI